jgi:hypothetical protein
MRAAVSRRLSWRRASPAGSVRFFRDCRRAPLALVEAAMSTTPRWTRVIDTRKMQTSRKLDAVVGERVSPEAHSQSTG